jgi:hypothetical protein
MFSLGKTDHCNYKQYSRTSGSEFMVVDKVQRTIAKSVITDLIQQISSDRTASPRKWQFVLLFS